MGDVEPRGGRIAGNRSFVIMGLLGGTVAEPEESDNFIGAGKFSVCGNAGVLLNNFADPSETGAGTDVGEGEHDRNRAGSSTSTFVPDGGFTLNECRIGEDECKGMCSSKGPPDPLQGAGCAPRGGDLLPVLGWANDISCIGLACPCRFRLHRGLTGPTLHPNCCGAVICGLVGRRRKGDCGWLGAGGAGVGTVCRPRLDLLTVIGKDA